MRPNPPIESRFKPGASGNPGGRPKQSEAMKRIRALTQEQVEEVGDLILMGNFEALKALKDDPSASVLKTAIAAVAMKIIKKGDAQALNVLLDRLVGKIPSRYEADIETKFEIVRRVESLDNQEIAKRLPAALELLNSGIIDGTP
jgi:hypothetical protein